MTDLRKMLKDIIGDDADQMSKVIKVLSTAGIELYPSVIEADLDQTNYQVSIDNYINDIKIGESVVIIGSLEEVAYRISSISENFSNKVSNEYYKHMDHRSFLPSNENVYFNELPETEGLVRSTISETYMLVPDINKDIVYKDLDTSDAFYMFFQDVADNKIENISDEIAFLKDDHLIDEQSSFKM